ncbi:hypothetical protein ABK040_011090 [Willaertia magna]
MPQDDVVYEVMSYLMDEQFGDIVEDFCLQHCDIFDVNTEEQKFEYTNVYNKFLKLFENKLEEFLKQRKVTPQEFFVECKRLQDEEDDNEIIDFLTALSDYQVFIGVMKEVKLRKK